MMAPFTAAQVKRIHAAAVVAVRAKIRADAPGLFESTAESLLDQHLQDVYDVMDQSISAAGPP